MGTRIMNPGNLDIMCIAAGTVAAEARQRVAFRLSAWRLDRLAHDAALITAELVANACAATPEGEIRIRFSREPRSVLLGVWDGSDQMPTSRPVVELDFDDLDLSLENLDENGGWGLPLVQALCSECGVHKTSPHGKWVWVRLAT